MMISRKKIEYIANNIVISEHAKIRIEERLGHNVNIKQMILNSPLWFRNTDECITIAIDQNRYFVVREFEDHFLLITVKEASKNGYDVMDKFVLAYSGKERKEK